MSWGAANLSEAQAGFVEQSIGSSTLIEDLSWGLVDTRVLHVHSGGEEFIVKAAGAHNHHIHREITAHEGWTAPLLRNHRAGRLVAASAPLSVLVLQCQPGHLVEGAPKEFAADVHRQAGQTLRLLHDQHARRLASEELVDRRGPAPRDRLRSLRFPSGLHRPVPPDDPAVA